jgi:hypothetical protein
MQRPRSIETLVKSLAALTKAEANSGLLNKFECLRGTVAGAPERVPHVSLRPLALGGPWSPCSM